MPSRIRPCRCRVNDFEADGVWARHDLTSDWFYTFDPQGSVSQKVGRDGSVVCSSVHDAQGREGTTEGRTDPFNGFGGSGATMRHTQNKIADVQQGHCQNL